VIGLLGIKLFGLERKLREDCRGLLGVVEIVVIEGIKGVKLFRLELELKLERLLFEGTED
jgi:hypothetical protein